MSCERALPAEDPELLIARANLAAACSDLGEPELARELLEDVLEAMERTLPASHPELQRARLNLAVALGKLGKHAEAAALEAQALELLERELPADHPDLQHARLNLAGTLLRSGDRAGARALQELVVEARERSLPEHHPELAWARLQLADTLHSLGELDRALALQEQALASLQPRLPPEHPYLQAALTSLAETIHSRGEIARARLLQERALADLERALPADDPGLQRRRMELANTLYRLGDLQGARSLEESVLASFERVLPADHHDVARARLNLAATLERMGELEQSRALAESGLTIMARKLPPADPKLQVARQNLAGILAQQGELAEARALFEDVLAVFQAALSPEHPDLLRARQNFALVLQMQGELSRAREIEESVLELRERSSSPHDPELQIARLQLALSTTTLVAGMESDAPEREQARARCVELGLAYARSQIAAAQSALLSGSSREAEERVAGGARDFSKLLSLARGYGLLDPQRELLEAAFALSESTRGIAIASRGIARAAPRSDARERSGVELRAAGAELAELARRGGSPDDFHRARTRLEAAERAALVLVSELAGMRAAELELSIGTLADVLAEREGLIAFRRYDFSWARSERPVSEGSKTALELGSTDSLCAFVLARESAGGEARLVFVDLGPTEAVARAVHAWRVEIGAGLDDASGSSGAGAEGTRGLGLGSSSAREGSSQASALRRLLWDPLAGALGEAERVILLPDDLLHLVPFDALPLEESGALLGERRRIETRVAAWELLREPPAERAPGVLVALGGADFDEPMDSAASEESRDNRPPPLATAALGADRSRGDLRGMRFAPLAHTGPESRAIASLRAAVGADALLLEGRGASRAALEEAAPRARWLHVATHGWFAPESMRSWNDRAPDVRAGSESFASSSAEVVRGMSPMLLCGLAFAGANLGADVLGRAPGLMTAEELSTLDLSGCELAVLSACDTNVGERRAGQGVASLQKALHMAGARSAITSLWKVPDEATRELMLDFYRRLWVEKRPKHQALWEAKMRLRDAKDERGNPRYTLRDWAAWVLTGEPD